VFKASRGDMLFAVDDDPDGFRNNAAPLPAGRAEPQVGAFASTRHSSLIRSMLFNVV
jgi:hypothetical protein